MTSAEIAVIAALRESLISLKSHIGRTDRAWFDTPPKQRVAHEDRLIEIATIAIDRANAALAKDAGQ